MLLRKQEDVSEQRALPTSVMNDSNLITSVSAETVQLYYYAAGVLTSDAGQAAGVLVIGKLAYGPVLDDIGSKVGNKGNTSLAFTCLALTNERPFQNAYLEGALDATGTVLLQQVTRDFANGDYCIDYRTGTVYAKKATTASTMTSTSYKIPGKAPVSVTLSTSDIEIGAVEIKNGVDDTRAVVSTAGADAVSNTQNEIEVSSRLSGFNGTTWDRIRTAIIAATGTLTGILNSIPLMIYNTTRPAATAGQVLPAQIDSEGKQIVLPYARPLDMVSGVISSAMTGVTSTSLLAAPAAGLRNYITTIVVSNSHATVGTDMIIQDGNGGTTLMVIPAAAVFGGAVITLPTPLRQPTTATAIYIQNVTTGANTKASAVGYQAA